MQLFQIVVGMFVPELLYLMALGQYFDARGVRDTINARAEAMSRKSGHMPDFVTPEASTLFATIWGSLVSEKQPQFIKLDHPGCRLFERWTLVHGFYAIMGGFEMDASELGSERPERLRLRPHVLIDMADDGRFEDLNIAADELVAKSKFDILGSTIALAQALWFCAQIFARIHGGLAISLLEISTVAHVVMSTFSLCLWWNKPQSIARGHIIMHEPTVPELEKLARYERIRQRSEPEFHENVQRREHYLASNWLKKANMTANHGERFLRRSAIREAISESPFLSEGPENLWMFHVDQSREIRDIWFTKDSYYWSTAAFWAVVALYGGVHVAAWNSHFPTPAERIMWLTSSVVLTSVASAYGGAALLVMRYGSQRWKDLIPSPNGPPVRFAHIAGVLSIIGHIYMFVESWASLRSLPASASATVNWPDGIPHFS